MSARDELAKVIVTAYGEDAEIECPCEQDLDLADSILAAGWVKPHTVTTVEERNALPAGVLLKDAARMLWQLTMEGQWRVSGGASQWLSMEPVDMEFPAVVLHEP